MSSFFFKEGIHSTASVDNRARIGANVAIGPYSCIGPEVSLHDNVKIAHNVIIGGKTTIGDNTSIYPFNVLGGPAQDLKYLHSEDGILVIGKDNIIREKCSIHTGTPVSNGTMIGNNNYIMVDSHIGHDCIIGNHTVIASVGLAGHVEIDDYVVLGAKSGIHQFCRIGKYAMTAGVSAITKDVPPYALSDHNRPNEFAGVNIIGLRRHDFEKSDIQYIRKVYKYLYSLQGPVANRIKPVLQEFPDNKIALEITDFINKSKRNLCMPPFRS